MTSNFERFQEIKKQADSGNYSSLINLKPKKCQMSGIHIWESCSPLWSLKQICAIFLMVLTFTKWTSKPWGRLRKFLWPSQKSWTLQNIAMSKTHFFRGFIFSWFWIRLLLIYSNLLFQNLEPMRKSRRK